MSDERPYRAYLVRLWTIAQDGGLVWRASVEDVHTGKRYAFPDLADLCCFLREAINDLSNQAHDQLSEIPAKAALGKSATH